MAHMQRVARAALWRKLNAVQIYGANTGVGKTIVSTLLCKTLRYRHPNARIAYIKPVSTGPDDEADESHILKHCSEIHTTTLYQYMRPVSPHIAAREVDKVVSDIDLTTHLYDTLMQLARDQTSYAMVETAGGVLSPAPSGTTQADCYRPLRLPALLVGDHRLGGIGSTISAWESLRLRGYNVDTLTVFDDQTYGNADYLKDYFHDKHVQVHTLPLPPERHPDATRDENNLAAYYDHVSQSEVMTACVDRLSEAHKSRLEKLESLSSRAHRAIWHPFMQHSERSAKTILAIDSAYGDDFQALSPSSSGTSGVPERSESLLQPALDGSAPWWTQGLGHGNPDLALTAANAAGRYGHVMFANAAHEPAVSLAETLLTNMHNERLSRVFYSDNGSTGMEVAVKMATRAATKRYGWKPEDEVSIIGLQGSYHGDTMGTMDCSEPSVYNTKVQWYQNRGFFFDFPKVMMKQGQWLVELPTSMHSDPDSSVTSYASLDEIFDLSNRHDHAAHYERYIETVLQKQIAAGAKFGALIMEPILLGAGGMLFIDPLFQHVMVQVVRRIGPAMSGQCKSQNRTDAMTASLDWSGVPVIHDEVFTGMYRLGEMSSSHFLQVEPDIAVHAKLLTGGLLPLCTTLASESIFEAFLSADKSDALLHGHSYTAHAVGCQVAQHSIEIMQKLRNDGAWNSFKQDWFTAPTMQSLPSASPRVWSMWSRDFVASLSHRQNVDHVVSIGSVLVISMRDPEGAAGYTSLAAAKLRDALLQNTRLSERVIHSRVLGNVLYLMASLTTSRQTLADVEGLVDEAFAALL